MSTQRIKGEVIALIESDYLANELPATLCITRDEHKIEWLIIELTSPIDIDQAVAMMRKEAVVHLSFHPLNGTQSYMGEALIARATQKVLGTSLELTGKGVLHSFVSPNGG